MLIIECHENSQNAIISMDDYSLAWGEIRRVCQENGEVVITSELSLEMPWWAFLSARKAIRIVAVKYEIELYISDAAKERLGVANAKRSQFKSINLIQPALPSDIKSRLQELGFDRLLTEHQLRNVSKISVLSSAATFSVPGAGKTTEALAYYYLKKEQDTLLFIVAPKNAFAAWDEQLKICMPNEQGIVRLVGGEKNIDLLIKQKPKLMIITYQQLVRVLKIISSYLSSRKVIMFLDESHRIKSGDEIVTGKAVLALSHIPKEKLIMSGTPMPNSPIDLIPQFNFLYPEVFVDEETIVNIIKPIYVRTTKNELGLKKPIYKIVEVEMSDSQRKLYDMIRSEEVRQLEKLRTRDKNALRKMGKSVMTMLQIASNPALLLRREQSNNEFLSEFLIEEDSPKIKYICNRARQLANQGKKCIIWSTFVGNIELLTLRLKDLGADFIHGGVDAGNEDDDFSREGKIKRFHDDKHAFVLVANPAAAGEGISLHKVCHNAIYADRNYNAAQFLQSVDRIHRLGLDVNIETEVEILLCPDSIDVSVDRRLTSKIARMSEVLEDSSLQIEAEYVYPENFEDSLTEQDFDDFLKHLKGN